MTMLAVENLSIAFGGVRAVADLSLAVQRGELLGLIGPNGAGKTTLLRLMTGVLVPDTGVVRVDGRDITRMPIHRRAQLGFVLTHQVVRPFREMSLLENVMIAAAQRQMRNPWRALVSVDTREARERAMRLLERLGIADAAAKSARSVPLGYLKRMQVARALALDPQLLLLDEPLAGLNYTEARRLADLIVELNAGGLTIVLVEHNLGEVTRIASRLLVLHNGATLAQGAPREVMARSDVRSAYLGGESVAFA
ncbi:MAG TPA: ATP-binding cassette domain-containing protein [Zeimonas sp.]|jgi:branched-chain amino acid transport system ATP-binding protein|nr:ATP-binding cassette domain-containing protein [Zeimonas sp.]